MDFRVRLRLADSLHEIADAIGDEIGFTKRHAEMLAKILRARSVPPCAYLHYANLVEAAFDNNAIAASGHAQSLYEACKVANDALKIDNLADDDLGPGQAEEFCRLVSDEPGVSFPLEAVTLEERLRATSLIQAAFALFGEGAPEIAAELRALIQQIILVRSVAPAGDREALVLDGASSFYLWGALFLNSERQKNRLSMALALVHEASHGLLFGMTLGAPCVTNPPAERFSSPLRYDPRPMDGVVHATYVLARMINCLQLLLQSSALDVQETAQAKCTLDRLWEDYKSGLKMVDESASFTPEGAAAFAGLRQTMDASQ